MAITEREFEQAGSRMKKLREAGHAVAARYDRRRARIVVRLASGIELTFPPHMVEGLADASADDLSDIEVSSTGLGLHWPRLDADVYVPALLEGVLGSRRWVAQQLGAAGGISKSEAKAAAARENGKKGGRPPGTHTRKAG